MFRGIFGAMGQEIVNTVPAMGGFLRAYAPAYLAHVTPTMSQFLADQHRAMEQTLTHIEDPKTRAMVAAILLAGSKVGIFTSD